MRYVSIPRVLSLAVLLSFPAGRVSGQTPVGFLPGLNGHSSEWTSTGSTLATQFNISPFYPDYNPNDVFNTNRAMLSTLGPTTILVGHSAGGVLARYTGQGQPLGGVVTYGSPNYGAPLEETYPVFCGFVGGTAFDAFVVFSDMNWIPGAEWVIDNLQPDYDFIISETLGGVCDGIAQRDPLGLPAGAELGPDAAFIVDTLDAAANVATEVANVAQEASVVVTAHDYFDSGAYRDLAGDNYGMIIGHISQYLGGELELEGAQIEYNDPDDPDMLNLAYDLEALGDDLLFMDEAWCESVSGSWYLCYPNDEAVPTSSQDLGRGIRLYVNPGPIHTEEVQSSVSHLASVFGQFTIGASGGGGGGEGSDSVSVSMNGPTTVKPGATCAWFVTVAGGTAPYSYYWTPGGYTGGPDYDYTNSVSNGGSFTVAVTVTDTNGAHGTTSQLVHVSNTAMDCPN